MPFDPWTFGLTALPLAAGAIAGRHEPKPFSFQFNENDPELEYMRRNILLGGQKRHRDAIDEIGRAGMLGSSSAFNQLNNQDLQTTRDLEDAAGSIYGTRRKEAHDDWLSNLEYGRGVKDNSLGAIGELGGSMLQDYWRKRFLGPSHWEQGPDTWKDWKPNSRSTYTSPWDDQGGDFAEGF